MNLYLEAAKILAGTKKALAFTGAGISAESGIPTFRDPGGIWDQFDPEEFGTVGGILAVVQKRPDVFRNFLLNTVETFIQSQPNAGHHALAELEKMGTLFAIITQNIDNLHTDAGNREVLEVHGNLFRARCTRCGRRYALDKAQFLERAGAVLADEAGFSLERVIGIMDKCECGGMTRPDVVMFGEAVQMLHQSFKAVAEAQVVLVMGTSGVVYPAAAIPHQARQAGAKIIEINPTENSYAAVTDVYIAEASAVAMPKVMEELKKLV
jgi:NAD-dependent deacetylase